ncbi:MULTISPECIES: DUF1398 family protein [unclassified Chelatococcus]|uniref:DUF1398 domain-containing protein n=1 Tax=unclassified Chelatococcus TaxID=2638111 RepID=UPI001BCFE2D8|nr:MULTISPECIES: DUF1398 family protein [unclassified Chelatococcus]MBS7700812.1 DUF1398 family protein [Chelatococcus sp. YT9]MBX3559670.1 DUF1398 family protein [Chelatococcus sp.]
MNDNQRITAQACLEGAEANTLTFPQIIGKLMGAGFESYAVDFRRQAATYYLPDGESVEFMIHKITAPVAETFNPRSLQEAIREAQQMVPGYTYKGFCKKAVAAGCAGYVVSFSGRRALYIGRTAETHVEYFPD